jgi:hypothetical protein
VLALKVLDFHTAWRQKALKSQAASGTADRATGFQHGSAMRRFVLLSSALSFSRGGGKDGERAPG